MKFCIGDRVEVEGHDQSLQGSYFASTLIDISRENSDYQIKYDNLHKNKNSSKKLKEYVDRFFVRPEPPLIQDPCYNLHEHEVEKAYKLHDLRVHYEWEEEMGQCTGASSCKPRPKHR
ncbi:hypothetical protein M9H77_12927 [Catharanthus roseus]|uniref:Uncharacterized protein n=1 Tax=Catharanthus roseus TaxID=4058 RepID=A0ACC0BIZ3_CATRO|nr:hypothetical protein M9H77_12927 [Catharanthus roseus]